MEFNLGLNAPNNSNSYTHSKARKGNLISSSNCPEIEARVNEGEHLTPYRKGNLISFSNCPEIEARVNEGEHLTPSRKRNL